MKNISAIFLVSSILLPITNLSAAPIYPETTHYAYLSQEFGNETGLGTKVDSFTCENDSCGYYGSHSPNYFEASLPFSVNYAGNNYQKVFADIGGNLTFTQEDSLGDAFQSDSTFPRITALNSKTNSYAPYISESSVYVGRTEGKFAITWENLTPATHFWDGEYVDDGIYGPNDIVPLDASNTFQLVLIDRADTGEGNFDVEFRYENVEWWSYDEEGDYRGFDGGPGTEEIQNSDRNPETLNSRVVDHYNLEIANTIREAGFDAYQVRDGIAYYTDYRDFTNPLFEFQTPPENTGDMALFQGCIDYFNSIEGTPEYDASLAFLPAGKSVREGCAEIAGVDLSDEVLVSTGTGSAEDPFMPISGEEVEGWNFAFEVVAGQLQAIDPDVAVGYEYVVNSGPNIQSVVLPTGFDDNLFDIFTKDNDSWQLIADDWLAGNEFVFSQAVTEFKIEGIDISNEIDPLDPQAFVTQISFDDSGFVDMTQTPITQYVTEVPEPQTLFIFAGALSGLALMRRRKLIVK